VKRAQHQGEDDTIGGNKEYSGDAEYRAPRTKFGRKVYQSVIMKNPAKPKGEIM
jgi:hypothetical protein